MATYLELKAQAEALAQQAEEARLSELDSIISTMREQIAEYGITVEQLFGRRRAGHQASVRRSRRSIAIRKAARPGAGAARLRSGLRTRRIAIGF